MRALGLIIVCLAAACGTTKPEETSEAPEVQRTEEEVRILKLEEKAAALERTTEELASLREKAEEVKRRLTVICTDYPEHGVCRPQTDASYARAAFCEDKSFTRHVDEVVEACHQGQCKQIDDARFLKRVQYMTLVHRLPHTLLTFGEAKTRLDRKDKRQAQQFVEQIGAEGGYVIVVGRASRDGTWRQNVKLALDRAENTRQYLVEQLGFSPDRVGYITYGHEKMYLTELDAERLANAKMSVRQANRSALLFAYPCYDGTKTADDPDAVLGPDPEAE